MDVILRSFVSMQYILPHPFNSSLEYEGAHHTRQTRSSRFPIAGTSGTNGWMGVKCFAQRHISQKLCLPVHGIQKATLWSQADFLANSTNRSVCLFSILIYALLSVSTVNEKKVLFLQKQNWQLWLPEQHCKKTQQIVNIFKGATCRFTIINICI